MRQLFGICWKMAIAIGIWLTVAWLVGYLHPLDSNLGVELPAWVQVPGIVATVIGSAGVFACGVMLSTTGIGTLRGNEWLLPQDFLATGLFRFVRNPMSLSGVILMIGIALWHRSALALGLAAGLFLLFHAIIVWVEEPGLERRFGESYREYKRRVSRWVPTWRAGGTPWTP